MWSTRATSTPGQVSNLSATKIHPIPKRKFRAVLIKKERTFNKKNSTPSTSSNTTNTTLNTTKTHACFAMILPFNQRTYSDLTGKYPHKSSCGNQYIFVVYDHDSNAILAEPLKNRTAAEITRGWLAIDNRLKRHFNAPKLYILDKKSALQIQSSSREEGTQISVGPSECSSMKYSRKRLLHL